MVENRNTGLKMVATLCPNGEKEINLDLSNIVYFVLIDFLTDLNKFFTNPFDREVFPRPPHLLEVEDKNSPSMSVKLSAS
jgi:hypothetical protein